MDHIFIDLGLTSTDKDGEITAIAAVRTDGKGKVLASFADDVQSALTPRSRFLPFVDVMDHCLSTILAPHFSKEYVIVATHADIARAFLKTEWKGIDLKRWTNNGHRIEPFSGRNWIDILQIAWPMCYNEKIKDRDFETLCLYFGVHNKEPGSALGDCEALVRCYWKLMHTYKIALFGEGLIREIGGKGYSTLVSFFK